MTELMRRDLVPHYRNPRSAHPGLLIQRGYPTYDQSEQGKQAKTAHISEVCRIPIDDLYRHAYERWVRVTANPMRFRSHVLRLDTRLFIGLSGGGMLETGCAIAHSYGVPYIPGSSVKGAVRAHVSGTQFGERHRAVCEELFGTEPIKDDPQGRSGLVTFHDAWWVPESAPQPHRDRPLVAEVVTTHHPDYYRTEGQDPATDLDSPIPNAQIAVQGAFLFALEGEPAWTDLALQMLVAALAESGVGAKTRAGYGYLSPDERLVKAHAKEQDQASLAAKPKDERLREEARRLTPEQLAEDFGTRINKTRERLGEDFDAFSALVRDEHRATLDAWEDETKQSNKARWKARRNLMADEAGGAGDD
jgi:CRISPR-associated protein Cmr6